MSASDRQRRRLSYCRPRKTWIATRLRSARQMGDQQLVELPNGDGVTMGLELLTNM
jgi:hypothetical protein